MAYQRAKHPVYHGGMNQPEQITEEFLSCPLCHAPGLRHPKSLPCGHSACLDCLRKVVPPQVGATFACPSCHVPTRTPLHFADGFPNNLFAASQLDTLLRRHNQTRRRDDTFYMIDTYEIRYDGHAYITTDLRH